MDSVPTSGLHVKICGVRRLEDALIAADAGADYVGMVFVPGRRRRVEPTYARRITDGLRQAGLNAPKSVGLFGDQPLPDVLQAIRVAGLDCVQLCGAEPLDYCEAALGLAHVIKVLHVPADADDDAIGLLAGQIRTFAALGCTVTLDSDFGGLHGGTGQSFDWSVAAALSETNEFLLAGGLTPDNVSDAVDKARPAGVDVSSGVETDGEKDAEKIRRFIANARAVGRIARLEQQ